MSPDELNAVTCQKYDQKMSIRWEKFLPIIFMKTTIIVRIVFVIDKRKRSGGICPSLIFREPVIL